MSKTRQDRHRSRNKRHTKNTKGRNVFNIVGKIIAVAELIAAIAFAIFLWQTGLVPALYMAGIGAGLLLLSVICLVLQIPRKKGYKITGMVFSILFILVFGVGIFYVAQMNAAVDQVVGATYKTDNMVVVVRQDDRAETLKDAAGYRFGYQTAIDQENTRLMREEVNKHLGQDVRTAEYGSVEELARALLDHKIDAAIYNEAFNGMIGDVIKDYESQIRILYQYGIDTELENEEKTVKQPFSVYISGIDVYGPITTTSRSDVNIIMTVNPATKQILLTTTPRDYYVEIPEISGGQKDKLTHAGIYGVDRSMAALENLYGIDIQYYARVNFTSLIQIVDVLGGLDVNSRYAFSSGNYKFHEGSNHLDGEAALAFSRERYSFEEGDNQRGKNQEAVLTAILQKAMSPAVLVNANELMMKVADSVETNMTKTEIVDLVRMQLEEGGTWNIVSVNAVGSGDSQPCYSSGEQLLYVMHPDPVSVSEISEKMNRVLSGETVVQ